MNVTEPPGSYWAEFLGRILPGATVARFNRARRAALAETEIARPIAEEKRPALSVQEQRPLNG